MESYFNFLLEKCYLVHEHFEIMSNEKNKIVNNQDKCSNVNKP